MKKGNHQHDNTSKQHYNRHMFVHIHVCMYVCMYVCLIMHASASPAGEFDAVKTVLCSYSTLSRRASPLTK